MPTSGLPDRVSVALAAQLARVSRRCFRQRYVEAGLVQAQATAGGRVMVDLASLERVIGNTVTAENYMAADRRLDAARDYQSQYRNQRRRGSAPAQSTHTHGRRPTA